MTAERKCKGSVIVDMAKIVRQFKDQPWDEYLKPEDWEIVNAMVIPTVWYPIETYQRIGLAVYKLIAKGNPEVVRSFGRAAMAEMLQGPYRYHLERGNPFEAVQKFMDLRKTLFNFSRMEMEKTGDQSLRVRILELGDFETGLDVFLLLAGVHFQHLVEHNGGKDVKLETRQEGNPGDRELVLDLKWN